MEEASCRAFAILADEHVMLRWAGGAFDPEAFDPATVKFDDPKKRWKKAFERRQ